MKIPWEGGGKLDPLNACGRDCAQHANLRYDLYGRAAALTPPGERDYAVGTELITALYDWDEGDIRRVALNRGDVPGVPFTALSDVQRTLFPPERPVYEFRQAISGASPRDQAKRRRMIEKGCPLQLRHAPHQTYQGLT